MYFGENRTLVKPRRVRYPTASGGAIWALWREVRLNLTPRSGGRPRLQGGGLCCLGHVETGRWDVRCRIGAGWGWARGLQLGGVRIFAGLDVAFHAAWYWAWGNEPLGST
jgi:hypothetical protein